MHLCYLGATLRGHLVLQRLLELAPDVDLTVATFREEPHEPPFLEGIRTLADDAGARFVETRRIASPRHAALWQDRPVDLILACSWRYLVPSEFFECARVGAYVFHDSLLPEYRGFSPTVWAIVNGEDHTGVTLFNMSDAVDAGDIVAQRPVTIGPREQIAEVMNRVTDTYLTLLDEYLPHILDGTAPRRPQDETRATYCCKRLPQDNLIDWNATSASIHNLVRAVSRPYPGAKTRLDGRGLTIWKAQPIADRFVGRVPGRIARVIPGIGAVVLTGDGGLLVEEVQRDGEEKRNAAEVLNSLGATLGRA